MTDTRLPPATLTIRLAPEERMIVERESDGMSMSGYVRWLLFHPHRPPPRPRRKTPIRDERLLSQILARLGRSQVPNNLNQIARAANIGALVLTPELEAELRASVAEIRETLRLITEALERSDER